MGIIYIKVNGGVAVSNNKDLVKSKNNSNQDVQPLADKGSNTGIELASNKEQDTRKQFLALGDLMLKHANERKVPDAVMAEIKKGLSEHPKLWRLVGDMAGQARLKLISQHTVGPVADEAMHKGYHVTLKELGYDEAPALEKLLIEQVGLCWLQVYIIHYLYVASTGENYSFRGGEHWEKRLTLAQKRYLRAIETLAKVRKLGPKVVMLNVAHQQVNAVIEK